MQMKLVRLEAEQAGFRLLASTRLVVRRWGAERLRSSYVKEFVSCNPSVAG